MTQPAKLQFRNPTVSPGSVSDGAMVLVADPTRSPLPSSITVYDNDLSRCPFCLRLFDQPPQPPPESRMVGSKSDRRDCVSPLRARQTTRRLEPSGNHAHRWSEQYFSQLVPTPFPPSLLREYQHLIEGESLLTITDSPSPPTQSDESMRTALDRELYHRYISRFGSSDESSALLRTHSPEIKSRTSPHSDVLCLPAPPVLETADQCDVAVQVDSDDLERLTTEGVQTALFDGGSSSAPGAYLSHYKHHFQEVKLLGRGAYSSVYLCRHICPSLTKGQEPLVLGMFAVKKIPVGDDDKYLCRVLREVMLLTLSIHDISKCKGKWQGNGMFANTMYHPNVVQYYHCWLEDPPKEAQTNERNSGTFPPVVVRDTAGTSSDVRCLYILQEYANEGSLDKYLHKYCRLHVSGSSVFVSEVEVELEARLQFSTALEMQGVSRGFLPKTRKLPTLTSGDLELMRKLILRRNPNAFFINSPSTIVMLFSSAVAGIGFLHQKGILHRDAKPENLFLTRDEVSVVEGHDEEDTDLSSCDDDDDQTKRRKRILRHRRGSLNNKNVRRNVEQQMQLLVPPRVMVGDFGTAALISELREQDATRGGLKGSGSGSGIERTGATGTLDYMAPELFVMADNSGTWVTDDANAHSTRTQSCNSEADLRSSFQSRRYRYTHTKACDVWSLGVILHYLIFGGNLPLVVIDTDYQHDTQASRLTGSSNNAEKQEQQQQQRKSSKVPFSFISSLTQPWEHIVKEYIDENGDLVVVYNLAFVDDRFCTDEVAEPEESVDPNFFVNRRIQRDVELRRQRKMGGRTFGQVRIGAHSKVGNIFYMRSYVTDAASAPLGSSKSIPSELLILLKRILTLIPQNRPVCEEILRLPFIQQMMRQMKHVAAFAAAAVSGGCVIQTPVTSSSADFSPEFRTRGSTESFSICADESRWVASRRSTDSSDGFGSGFIDNTCLFDFGGDRFGEEVSSAAEGKLINVNSIRDIIVYKDEDRPKSGSKLFENNAQLVVVCPTEPEPVNNIDTLDLTQNSNSSPTLQRSVNPFTPSTIELFPLQKCTVREDDSRLAHSPSNESIPGTEKPKELCTSLRSSQQKELKQKPPLKLRERAEIPSTVDRVCVIAERIWTSNIPTKYIILGSTLVLFLVGFSFSYKDGKLV